MAHSSEDRAMCGVSVLSCHDLVSTVQMMPDLQ